MATEDKKQSPSQNGVGTQPSAKPKAPAQDQRPDQPLKQVNED